MARNGVRGADITAVHPPLKYRATFEKSLSGLGIYTVTFDTIS